MSVGAIGMLATLGITAPSGAASVKPVAPAAHTVLSSHAAKIKKVAFKATISGKLALLWAASSVTASSVSGSGAATNMGTATLSGSGTAPFTGSTECEPMTGKGTLSGAGSTLSITVAPQSSNAAQACGAGSSTPTPVTVSKGVAKVTAGTGKYKGATGILNFKAVFVVNSTTSGSSESDSFTATIAGTLTIKG
jgi:hypothetical protein